MVFGFGTLKIYSDFLILENSKGLLSCEWDAWYCQVYFMIETGYNLNALSPNMIIWSFIKKLNLPRFHGMSKIPLIIMNMVRINWTGASTHPAIPCETLIKKILSLSKIFIFNQWKKKPIVKEFDWRTKELNHEFICLNQVLRFKELISCTMGLIWH